MIKKSLIEINQTCNLNCEYCFYKDYGRSNKILNTNDILEVLDLDIETIYITGGEPFLNPHLFNIIDLLINKKKTVIIFTNGSQIVKLDETKFQGLMNTVKKLIVTFDSFDEAYELRGDSKETIASIKRILKYSTDSLEVKICISKFNYKSFERNLEKLISLGVQNISVNFIHNIESSNYSFGDFNKSEYRNIFEIIYKNKKYFNIKYINILREYFLNDNDVRTTCVAGKYFGFIDCKKRKFLCPANMENKKDGICFSEECISLWEIFLDGEDRLNEHSI